jgi:hypothetical protein
MSKTIITAAVLVFSAAAYANTISLGAVNGNVYQQTVQSPCVFSNSSCKQPAGFPSTDLDNGGAVTGYDAFSPVYSGSTIQGIIGAGNSILLGLDINQASGQPAQTLSAFYMLKNGSVVDTFLFAGTGNVPAGNNGNGYADFLLGNFSSFLSTDTIQFHFVFNDANDGTENVFLIGAPGTPTSIPEPTSLALLGSGLLIVAAKFRKKAKI